MKNMAKCKNSTGWDPFHILSEPWAFSVRWVLTHRSLISIIVVCTSEAVHIYIHLLVFTSTSSILLYLPQVIPWSAECTVSYYIYELNMLEIISNPLIDNINYACIYNPDSNNEYQNLQVKPCFFKFLHSLTCIRNPRSHRIDDCGSSFKHAAEQRTSPVVSSS